MGLFDGIEKLINEHGSATILKERIALANDKHAALEKKVVDLQAENGSLKEEISILNAENEALRLNYEKAEEKIGTLEKKLIEKSHSDLLVFNQETGSWVDEKTSIHYCAKCKIQNSISPMQDSGHGWHCAACGTSYNDPKRPWSIPVQKGDWMAR